MSVVISIDRCSKYLKPRSLPAFANDMNQARVDVINIRGDIKNPSAQMSKVIQDVMDKLNASLASGTTELSRQ
jgi:hypothetical protein